MLDVGDKCICQEDDWCNAFGDKYLKLHRGQRLTVSGIRNVGGTSFLEFNEVDKAHYFMALGFTPLRAYN